MVAGLVFLRREGGGGGFHFFLGFWRDLSCKDFVSVCYLFLIMIYDEYFLCD